MAAITAVSISTTPFTSTPVASAPAGDTIAATTSDSLILILTNGHGSSITVSITPQAVSTTVAGYGSGSFTPATLSVAVPAGATRTIYIPHSTIGGYIDGS